VQERLFEERTADAEEAASGDDDPYQDVRAAAHRLTVEYAIDEGEAFDLILAFGSEAGARRALQQRWWLGEVELREGLEAA